MNENHNGETPQNGESQPQDPAMDQNNKASEPSENQPAADDNNKPENGKKPRKTDAERLIELKKKLKTVAVEERKVNARIEKAHSKELVKFKIVLGDACLNYIGNPGNPEQANRLIALLRKCANDCHREWLGMHFGRLLGLHAKPKPKQGGANGKSPSPS